MNDKVYNFLIRAGLTFILIWSPIAHGAVPKRIWSITPVSLVIIILTFLWLWRLNNSPRSRPDLSVGRQRTVRRTALDNLIITFVALAVISFSFSIYKHDSFYALLRLLGYVALFYLVVNNYNRSLRNYLLGLAICMGVGLSVYGLLQYFGFLPHTWWNPVNLLAATYVNHNHFSGYLELVIPVTVGALISLKNKIGTFPCGDSPYFLRSDKLLIGLLSIAFLIMLTAFIFAQSRGAWVSLGISLFVMNVILVKRKIFKKKSLLIFLLLIVIIGAFFYCTETPVSERIESIKQLPKGEASMSTRFAIWQGTIRMIRHRPWIGVGIGDFQWSFLRFNSPKLSKIKPHYAHNDYLHTCAEVGIPALLTMLIIFIRLIRMGLTKRNSENIILGCAIGMLSLCLHGLVDFNFHIPANMILFVVCGGIIRGESSERTLKASQVT